MAETYIKFLKKGSNVAADTMVSGDVARVDYKTGVHMRSDSQQYDGYLNGQPARYTVKRIGNVCTVNFLTSLINASSTSPIYFTSSSSGTGANNPLLMAAAYRPISNISIMVPLVSYNGSSIAAMSYAQMTVLSTGAISFDCKDAGTYQCGGYALYHLENEDYPTT